MMSKNRQQQLELEMIERKVLDRLHYSHCIYVTETGGTDGS